MKFLKQIQEILDAIDIKMLYRYLGAAIGALLLLVFFMMYRFYTTIDHYKERIEIINEQREEVQELLEKAALVKEQKKEVNAMLKANPNFKIGGYFKDLISQLNLNDKLVSSGVPSRVERLEQEYDESILTAKFTDMNMRDVSELLEKFEQNKRVYTKDLSVAKSRKKPRTLDVQLTIATLQPRTV